MSYQKLRLHLFEVFYKPNHVQINLSTWSVKEVLFRTIGLCAILFNYHIDKIKRILSQVKDFHFQLKWLDDFVQYNGIHLKFYSATTVSWCFQSVCSSVTCHRQIVRLFCYREATYVWFNCLVEVSEFLLMQWMKICGFKDAYWLLLYSSLTPRGQKVLKDTIW